MHRWSRAKGHDEPRNHRPDIFDDGFRLGGCCPPSAVAPQGNEHRNEGAVADCQQGP